MLGKFKGVICRIFENTDSQVEHSVLKIQDAYLCCNSLDDNGAICGEVFRGTWRGCPDCGSQSICSLSWLLKSAAERQEWLDKIGAAKTRRIVAPSRKATGPEAA